MCVCVCVCANIPQLAVVRERSSNTEAVSQWTRVSYIINRQTFLGCFWGALVRKAFSLSAWTRFQPLMLHASLILRSYLEAFNIINVNTHKSPCPHGNTSSIVSSVNKSVNKNPFDANSRKLATNGTSCLLFFQTIFAISTLWLLLNKQGEQQCNVRRAFWSLFSKLASCRGVATTPAVHGATSAW